MSRIARASLGRIYTTGGLIPGVAGQFGSVRLRNVIANSESLAITHVWIATAASGTALWHLRNMGETAGAASGIPIQSHFGGVASVAELVGETSVPGLTTTLNSFFQTRTMADDTFLIPFEDELVIPAGAQLVVELRAANVNAWVNFRWAEIKQN